MSLKIKSGVFRAALLKVGTLFRCWHAGHNFRTQFPRLTFESIGPSSTIILGYSTGEQSECWDRERKTAVVSFNGDLQNRMEQRPHHNIAIFWLPVTAQDWVTESTAARAKQPACGLETAGRLLSRNIHPFLFPAPPGLKSLLQLSSWQIRRPEHAQHTTCRGKFCKT